MNAKESNRNPALVHEDDGGRLSIIVEHDDGDSPKAAGDCPARRKLVTFEKLPGMRGAARQRLESDIRRLRASGSMIRRTLESMG